MKHIDKNTFCSKANGDELWPFDFLVVGRYIKHVCLRFRAYAIEVNLQHRQGYLQALQHCRCFYVGSFVYPSAKTIAEEFVEGACITTYL